MELLNDSEAEQLRRIRNEFAQLRTKEASHYTEILLRTADLQFLLQYIGELENELWSRDHG